MSALSYKQLSLYSFGSNVRCQLSQPIPNDLSTPTLVPLTIRTADEKPIELRSNGNHTLLLVSDQLYACGQNSNAECFFPHSEPIPVFKRVVLPGTPSLIAAGWEFSVVVTTDGSVYVSGLGLRGELGLGAGVTSAATALLPQFVPTGARIVQIAAGLAHVIVLLDNNELWGWGHSRKGQLGSEHCDVKSCWSPVKIALPADYIPMKICCGREFSAMIDAAGRVLVLHTGTSHLGFVRDVPKPALDWIDFQCGWSSLHILLRSGEIISWGNNSHSQAAPADAPAVVQMSCGSEHTLVLAKNSKVYAWGWGEHGNCGPLPDKGAVNVGSASVVFDGSTCCDGTIVFLGSGCATSWIGVLK